MTMDPMGFLLLVTTLAGLAMPVGALLAAVEHIHPRWLEQELRHTVLAFGGGALLSAVALVLIPESLDKINPVFAAPSFIAGGMAFMWVDEWLARRKTGASQLLAMLLDFVPESMALGAMVALEAPHIGLLAFLIGLQNLPEGFNAFRELRQSTRLRAAAIVFRFAQLALLGPLCALLGYHFLAQHPQWMAAIMMFAAGGILYSVFGDIAPQAKLDKRFWPPMGAILGFALGLMGQQL